MILWQILKSALTYKGYLVGLVCCLAISTTLSDFAGVQAAIDQLKLQHYQKALYMFQYESEHNNNLSTANLGAMYENGEGVKQNIPQALHYYQLAANSGYAKAMLNIGYIYQVGEGMEKNKALAVKWYLKAIKHGMALFAGRNLADLYYNEKPSNFKKAHYYYWLSARQGNGVSLYKLGLMALKGQGEPANLQQAYNYFYKAKLAGIKQATIEIKKLESKLSAMQQQQLQEGTYQSQTPRPTQKTMKTVAQP